MFPVTDSSKTVIDCLLGAARAAGVELVANRAPERVIRRAEGGFELTFENGETLVCERMMLATGGCRVPAAGQLAVSLGHTLEPPIPSLFTFHIAAPWLHELAGISLPAMEVSLPGLRRRERGPVLITHSGLSGPAVLRLSAWCARALHDRSYQFPLRLNWLPHLDAQALTAELESRRRAQPARFVVNTPLPPLPARLWRNLVLEAGIEAKHDGPIYRARPATGLSSSSASPNCTSSGKRSTRTSLSLAAVCDLSEVNFKTMESRICPSLYLGGELLDIDGLTGGFNFQAAWTTGWLAGRAMSGQSDC